MPGSVVVTGGSRGIGRAFVVEAARRGHDVLFTHRGRTADVEATLAEASAAAPKVTVTPVEADVTDAAALAGLAEAARAHGPVDHLVNNAGTLTRADLDSTTDELWQQAFAVHVTAAALLARELADALAETQGSILNVASTGGLVGSLHGVAYGASKAATVGLGRTLARELAPRVRVNTIAPGPIATDMWGALPQDSRDGVESTTLLGRVGDPAEIARTGLDLCGWTYATGITVIADGGRVMS